MVGRFNSRKDPNYRDTEADDRRPTEWVCSDRGKTEGCSRVFHVQEEYIEHIKVKKSAGGNCPDRRVSRFCRDEGSIRGCGKEFNRLDAYQEHINIRNKTRDRRCPELGPEVRSREEAGVKAELRPGPLYSGDVVEVDIADSPEYVAPGSPVSPPSSSALVTPSFSGITSEKAASPDRSVSPPPCDPLNPVSVRDDGVILIQPSSLPDLVTSSNPGPSFKIRIPSSRPVEKEPTAPSAGEPGKLDVTPVNRTGDSDVAPCTPLMGNVSSAMTGASPVAESTPKTLSVATAEKASIKEDVPVTHPTPVQDLVTDADAKCVQSDLSSVKGNIMSDKGPSSAKESEKEKRGKFKLPSCFADANEISSPSTLSSLDKVSAKRKSQDDEMELLLDKKKRSQILKKNPIVNEQPSPKEPEVLTVSTSTSVDDSQEAAELKNEVVLNVETYLSSSSQKQEEIKTSQPPKLSFGPPAASKKVIHKPTNTSPRENVPSKVSSSPVKTKKIPEKKKLLSNEKKLEKATVKASKKSEIVKPARKNCSQEKSKKSHKRSKEKSNDKEPKLFETDQMPKKSIKKPPLKTGNLLEEIQSKEEVPSKHVDESGNDQYNEEATLDDLLADDDEELEKEKPNEKDVTEDEIMERIDALFMSTESTKTIHPTEDKDADNPSSILETLDSSNKAQNTDQSVREIVMQALEETNSSEDTGPAPKPMVTDDQTDYNLIKPEHLLPSESTVSPDKVVVKFSGDDAPEMVSIDPDDRDVDSSYEPPVKVTPNTSVSPLCKRIMEKESEVHFSRDETNRSSEVEESLEKDDSPGHMDVEHSSDRETEVAISTSHVYSSTLTEAQKTKESSDVEESLERGGKDDDSGNSNVDVEASSSDGETEVASEGPLSPSKGHISTLREALLDTDEDLEEETEDEEDEDYCELVWGKDSCSVCPSCQKVLTMKETNVSINLVDSSYIITCSSCSQKIVIRNLLSDRQKALLYSN